MTLATTNEERLEGVVQKCSQRPRVQAYIFSIQGMTLTQEQFINGYKALGLPRTSPAKGRGLYKFLVEENFITKI